MSRHGICYDWKLLGSLLANEDETIQADFFKAFVKEMATWGTTFQKQTQLIWVNKRLTDEEKDILSCLSYKGEN